MKNAIDNPFNFMKEKQNYDIKLEGKITNEFYDSIPIDANKE